MLKSWPNSTTWLGRLDFAAAIENYKNAAAIQERYGSTAGSLQATYSAIGVEFLKQGGTDKSLEYMGKKILSLLQNQP
jgi:hypothetical protein